MLNCHTRLKALPRLVLPALSLMLGFAAPAWAQRDWRSCASEGQRCRVEGESLLRFGTEGRYVFRVSSESLPCEIDSFGSDPFPGRVKQCEVSRDWRQDERYRGWGQGSSGGWRSCAYEGETCRVPGQAQVRYGVAGRFAERSITQSVACNNSVFGDPYPGVAKQCEYRPAQGTSSSGLPWSVCASEGGHCSFRGGGMLRYGAAGQYLYREAVNGLRCGNEEFGGDPAPGVSKQCELLRVAR